MPMTNFEYLTQRENKLAKFIIKVANDALVTENVQGFKWEDIEQWLKSEYREGTRME